MTVAIWSGPARVIAHATVTTFWGYGVYLEVPLPDRTFAIGFAFRADASDPSPRVETALLGDGVRLDLVNIDTAEGKGSSRPVLLGEVGDELLFLHFRAFRYGASDDRTLHYSVYLVAKSDAGWAPVVRDESGG